MSEGIIRRLESSIEFIIDDLTIKVGDFILGRADNGRIEVKGGINSVHKPNVSKQELQDLLMDMKTFFSRIGKPIGKIFSIHRRTRGGLLAALGFGEGRSCSLFRN